MNELDKAIDDASGLRAALERMLGEHFGREIHVARFERRPFEYATSSMLEAIDVELDDGIGLELLLKDVSRRGMRREASATKPTFLHNPLREIKVYQEILADCPAGPAACYGAVVDAGENRFWLLLERVDGRELYQIGERRFWQAAARWLAGQHSRWSNRVADIQRRAPVLNYDAEFYRVWLTRAVEFQTPKMKQQPRHWQRLIERYDRVIDRLLAMPKTFIHGEFYASNVLVDDAVQPARVCPVDWEMAAVGPGSIDMAALTAGQWSDEERAALLDAYRTCLEEHGDQRPLADLQDDLDVCRLHTAVQWLGWSPDWAPPTEHAHDWLAEAMALTEKLALLESRRYECRAV